MNAATEPYQDKNWWIVPMPEEVARRFLGEVFDYAVAQGSCYCTSRARGWWDANEKESYGAYLCASQVACRKEAAAFHIAQGARSMLQVVYQESPDAFKALDKVYGGEDGLINEAVKYVDALEQQAKKMGQIFVENYSFASAERFGNAVACWLSTCGHVPCTQDLATNILTEIVGPPTPESKPRYTYVCTTCGNDEVSLEGIVLWNKDTQSLEVTDLCDKGHECAQCDGPCRVERKVLVASNSTATPNAND